MIIYTFGNFIELKIKTVMIKIEDIDISCRTLHLIGFAICLNKFQVRFVVRFNKNLTLPCFSGWETSGHQMGDIKDGK